MSQTRIARRFKFDGTFQNPTSVVLADPTNTFGVKRNDTDAVVVADDTAMTNVTTGLYEHVFTDPADDLNYTWGIEYVFDGETYNYTGTIAGGTSSAENIFDLIPWIWVYLPDVPQPYLQQQISEVTRQFFRRTEVWREFLTAIPSVADQADYTLTTSHDAEFIRIKKVEYDTERNPYPGRFEVDEEFGTLTLDPAPQEADKDIFPRAVFMPSRDATTIPDYVLDRWGDAIVAGVISRLKAMPNRAWSDPGDQYWAREYKRLRSDAIREVDTLGGPAAVFMQKRRFV